MAASFSKREAALPGAGLSPRLSDPLGLQAGGGDGRLDGSRPPPFKIGPNDFGAVLRSNSRLPHLRGEFGGDRVRCGFKRIGRDVGIAARGLGTSVPQQFTDDRLPLRCDRRPLRLSPPQEEKC